jgi:argininosuccinate lyase
VEKGTTLEALPLKNYQAHSELFDQGIYDAISLEKCVNGRTVLGGPAPQNVEKEAKRILAMV